MANVAKLEDYLSEIMAELPGCPNVIALQALRKAVRDFQTETEIWDADLTINSVAGTLKYKLQPAYEASVLRLFKVTFDGSILSPDAYKLNFDQLTDSDYREFELELINDPLKTVTGGLVVNVILRSFIKAIDIPEYFFDRWGDGIMAKAKSDLMMQPKKPYGDRNLAVKYLGDYKNYVVDAKREKVCKFKQVNMRFGNPMIHRIF